MAHKAIPPDLEPALLAKRGEGLSNRELSQWLRTEHRVVASKAAVQRFIARVDAEREPMAAAITRHQLAKAVTADLDDIEQMLDDERELGKRVGNLDKQIAFLDKVQNADITKLFDEKTGAFLPPHLVPKDLALAIGGLDSEQLFAGDGEGRYRAGDTVKVKLLDKLRAVELLIRIRREAQEGRARLLELRLKLSGAGGNEDTLAARSRLLAKLEAEAAA